MKNVNEVIEKLNKCGITVDKCKENNKLCGYELNTYTDAGVNQILFIDFRHSEMSPKNAKHFIELFNETVNDIDIDDELIIHLEDERYRKEIGASIGVQDFKDWKANLLSIFVDNGKTAQQRQYEQTKDKFISALTNMEEILKLMPIKGPNPSTCQRTEISNLLGGLDHSINGITFEDFTPNNYSQNFKLTYS